MSQFHCTKCKATYEAYTGKCAKCGAWKTVERGGAKKVMLQSGEAVKINEISLEDNHRIQTGTREFDRVLGDSKNLGMVQGSIVLIGGEPGQGKACSIHTPVLTPSGWKKIGKLSKGDWVIGRDGQPTEILDVYPQGVLPLFEVKLSDGGKTNCAGSHLWTTRTRNDRTRGREGSVKTTEDLIKTLLRPDGGLNHSIPFVDPVKFEQAKELPLDPYLLGFFLADGSYTSSTILLSKPEEDVIDKCRRCLPQKDRLVFQNNTDPKKQFQWYVRNKIVGERSVSARALQKLGLQNKIHKEKRIPEVYLRANIFDRIQLLQGLLDGDGHVATGRDTTGTTVEYATVSPQLATDVRDLVLCLGGRVTTEERTTQFTDRHGSRVDGLPSYRLRISFHDPSIVPVSSQKHLARFRHTSRITERFIQSITPIEPDEAVCIRVAREDGLYVTEECIVTHNSTLLLQVACELSEAEVDPCKVLYVSGEETPKQVRERAERIWMIDDSPIPLTKMWFMASQMLDEIEKRVLDLDPDILVIDSLQTMKLPGEGGNMSQQENCTKFLQNLTKARGITTFIVSHVTKDGGIAGPKQVEHLVDVVLSFDSERSSEIRTLRALKNRFGNTEEVGIFRMTSDGLKSVDNPAEFLIRGKPGVPGSCLAALMLKPGGSGPGKRAVLFEVQALLAPPTGKTGARVSQGYDQKRLNMLIAILTAHTPFNDIGQFDVYVNITPSDLPIEESSLDLPVALALISARTLTPIPKDVVAWGEMGLTGEVRPNDYGALTRKLGIVKHMKLGTPLYSTREAILSIQDAMALFPEPDAIAPTPHKVKEDLSRVADEIQKAKK